MKIYLDDIRTPKNIPTRSKIWAWLCNLFKKKSFNVDEWRVCRTPEKFKKAIQEWYSTLIIVSIYYDMEKFPYSGKELILSLDHDLGPEPTETGYDLIKWLADFIINATGGENNELDSSINLVELIEVNVHSANPVGKNNIERFWTNFKEFKLRGN